MLNVRTEKRGAERNKSDAHEQEQIEEQKGPVYTNHIAKHRMMIDPHDTDNDKADHIRDVGDPLVGEGRPQMNVQDKCAVLHKGHVDIQNQERDGNRKHPIAERFHSFCSHIMPLNSGTLFQRPGSALSVGDALDRSDSSLATAWVELAVCPLLRGTIGPNHGHIGPAPLAYKFFSG